MSFIADINASCACNASKTAKETTINKGDTYKVTLNENPKTGYTWSVTCSDGLDKFSEKLTPSKSCSLGANRNPRIEISSRRDWQAGDQRENVSDHRKKVPIKSFSIARSRDPKVLSRKSLLILK